MQTAMKPDYTPAEQEAEFALASEIGRLVDGHQADVLLNAMTRVMASVLAQADASDPVVEASLFSVVVINLHALVHPEPKTKTKTLVVGDPASKLSPEVVDAAAVLCLPLYHLLTGLRLHYEGRDVANAWTSVLLNLLLEDGPAGEDGLARAMRILQEIADNLPATHAQMQALRAMDDGANTSERGSA